MQESPACERLQEKKLPHPKEDNPLVAIFNHKYRRVTLLCSSLIGATTVGYYAAIAWMPAWINQLTGALSVQERTDATLYQSVGAFIGCLFVPYMARNSAADQ